MNPDTLMTLLVLAMVMTMGGCACCSPCVLCSDDMVSMQFHLITNADACNGSGCDNLTGEYVVDLEEDSCCAEYTTTAYSCSTDDCDTCTATPNGDAVVCCEIESELCGPYDATLPTAFCSPDTTAANCDDTEGCGTTIDLDLTASDSNCSSDPMCAGMFGGGDPGYSCERRVSCDCAGTCRNVQASMSACLELQGDHIHLTGTLSDGWRTYEFDEDLGAADTIECLTVLDAYAVTLSETTVGGLTNHLCTIVSLDITGLGP